MSGRPKGYLSYCRRGHALTDGNVYISISRDLQTVTRRCATCKKAWEREHHKKSK